MQTSIDINASPQAAWDIVTDLDRMGEWVTSTGAHFKQTLKVAGTPFQVEWTAETVDGPKRLSWTGTGPAGSTARTSYELTDHEGGTRFGYDNELSLPGGKVGEAAADVVSGAAEREADDSLGKLKVLAER